MNVTVNETTPTHAPEGFLGWVAELVHRHRARLIGYARRQGVSPEEALDCVQDAFQSFLALPEARGIAYVEEDSAKLLSVLLRHVVSNRRRTIRRRERILKSIPALDADTRTSDQLIDQAEQIARVRGCILRMKELHRRVVELSLLDERSGDDVATLLGITKGHARVLVHRAREHLRTCTYEPS